jgi:hypothetical protein
MPTSLGQELIEKTKDENGISQQKYEELKELIKKDMK